MSGSSFNESDFRSRVNSGIESVARVLETTRHPRPAAEIPHAYDDKFRLAEFVTNAGLAAQYNVLRALGFSSKAHIATVTGWRQAHLPVTLRFSSVKNCKFERKEVRQVESPTSVTETKTNIGISVSHSSKVVTRVEEWFWTLTITYTVIIFSGPEPSEENQIVLQSNQNSIGLLTTTEKPPLPEVQLQPAIDHNLTWFFSKLSEASPVQTRFSIDRSATSCHTPRRNTDIDESFIHFSSFSSWARSVESTINSDRSSIGSIAIDLPPNRGFATFVPILPLFEQRDEPGSPLLSVSDINRLLAEQKRSLRAGFSDIDQVSPARLFGRTENKLLLVARHVTELVIQHRSSVDYLEHLLYQQLYQALGKYVTAEDFREYMRFHVRKIFKPAFELQPFCHGVRRDGLHVPEGVLSIENTEGQPILTIVKSVSAGHPMKFRLDAATEVSFTGDRHVHAWVNQQFSGSSTSITLNARTRQFSSYILLVGKIASATLFEPKAAIILQNKDDVQIPLSLETIPTPKEFRDAIESLSPEQQRFCKAFRAMQLESTLFAVCVIQIKPQLEKLLKLPADALTKEIRLSQDILELVQKYQLPTDLITYDGPQTASHADMIAAVSATVERMKDLVSGRKKAQLQEKLSEAIYETVSQPPPAPTCQKHHPLTYTTFSGGNYAHGWICDGCRLQKPPGTYRWNCTICTYDLCDHCGGNVPVTDLLGLAGPPPPFPVSEGYAAPKSMVSDLRLARSSSSSSSSGGGGGGGGGVAIGSLAAFSPLGAPGRAGGAPPPVRSRGGAGGPPGGARGRGGAVAAGSRAPQGPSAPVAAQPTTAVAGTKPNSATAKPAEAASSSPSPSPSPSSEKTASLLPVETPEDASVVDYTQIPALLDQRFSALDTDNALRPTIIDIGSPWTKKSQASLLSSPKTTTLSKDEQKEEKKKAFDLLDAISRSGSLPIENASLHIVIGSTHTFGKSVVDSLIQDNINPIEKVERSTLIIATTIHDLPESELLK